jgi:hypothetical protein
MPGAENLRVIAEVGIAIAGFSGVVVALGRRAAGRESAAWQLGRLWMLLIQSLGATLFAFFPILLETAGLSPSANWRVCNGMLGLFGFGIVAGVIVTARRSRHSQVVGWPVLVGLLFIHGAISLAQVLQALGALPSIGAFLYFLALLWLLAMAGLNFAVLLLSAPRQG